MEGIKLTIAIIIAVILQWTLRNVADFFMFVDFPLIIVVYAALQRNSIRALLFATISGVAVDALSGGLLGASGFTMTVIAFIIAEAARRVYLDNLILRIPVIAGASILSSLLYFGIHKLFGQEPAGSLVFIGAYSLIGTMIGGTLIFLLLDAISAGKLKPRKREMFAQRRQTRRRNPIRLTK